MAEAQQMTEPPSVDNAELTMDYLLRRMRFKSDFPALSTSISSVQAFSDSDATDRLQSMADEILKDVALTQKLLRVVNTAHYRRAGSDPISTVSRAVALMGVGGVRNVALSLMLLDRMEDKAHAQQLKVEFLRTVMAGTLASELCATSKEAEAAYLGALFRNLGRLLVSFYLPDDAEQIRKLCNEGEDGQPPLTEARAAEKVLGVTLEQLADKVGRMWGLPDGLLACMASPEGDVPTQPLNGRPAWQWWLASLANETAQTMLDCDPADLGDQLQLLEARYAKALGIKPRELQEAAAVARKRLTEMTQALNMNLPQASPAERLLDHFYVDAPNAGQAAAGPTPEALGLGFDDDDLATDWAALETVDAASVLSSGIQDITNTLLETFKLNDVLHMILETMLRALNCRRVVFCLRDARTGVLVGRMAIGEGAEPARSVFQVPMQMKPGGTPDLFSLICLKNADMLIADAAAPNIAPRLPAWFKGPVYAQTFLLLPLTLKRKGQADMALGLIYADRAEAHSMQVGERELSLLRTLRNQAIMAFKQTTGG